MLKKILFGVLLLSSTAQANVVITGTRVIYPENEKTITVKLDNPGKKASLVQAWIDEGDPDTDPRHIQVPFAITPPVSRIESQSGQTLRITYTGTKVLPKDRESLFYFNLLDIPPKPSKEFLDSNQNFLQFAVRSRLKFFYRPENLPMKPEDAYKMVRWQAVSNGVNVDNPTPYYLSYVSAEVNRTALKKVRMVAPFSQAVFEGKGIHKGDKLKWYLVNDYGGDSAGEAILQ
ncbi:fimbria/pilus periplasmic chaperone [Haemophilus influenzae]|uniref:fimbria/pilus periplasmic chaperone n=1 Tax=Haemophilus influenzae TaxID=727 RepID=UPI003DA5BCCC